MLYERVSGLSPVASRLEIGWPLPARHATLCSISSFAMAATERHSEGAGAVRHDLGAISDLPRGVAAT